MVDPVGHPILATKVQHAGALFCLFYKFLGSKVELYIQLPYKFNNNCITRARNDFYLPATLTDQSYMCNY